MPEHKAKQNDWVQLHFTGTLENGLVFDASPEDEPLTFQIGSGVVLKAFEEHVEGMAINETRAFAIPPERAYGLRDETAQRTLAKNEIDVSLADIPEGEILTIEFPDLGCCPVKIIHNGPDTLLVDLNHPLAGETLHYQVKLLNIGQASEAM